MNLVTGAKGSYSYNPWLDCAQLKGGQMKGVGWYRGRGLRAQSPVQMCCVLSGTVFLSSKSYLDWKVFGFQLPCSWISRTSSWASTRKSGQGGRGRAAGHGGIQTQEFLDPFESPPTPFKRRLFFRAGCLECGGRASSIWAGLGAKNNVAKTLDIFY